MASTRASSLLLSLPRYTHSIPQRAISQRATSLLRHCLPQTSIALAIRQAHTIPRPRPSPSTSTSSTTIPTTATHTTRSSSTDTNTAIGAASPSTRASRPTRPSYELTFTCLPCSTRSSHTITKQAYHHGSVLITCPQCRNRHVIADHLRIFGDRDITVEDLMRERGRLVKRGTLGEDGDVEFWEDGTVTERDKDRGTVGDGPAPEGLEARPDAQSAAPGASFKSASPNAEGSGPK